MTLPFGSNVPSVLFLGLDAYSNIGGMQRFNQRLIAALSNLASTASGARLKVHLLRDEATDIPSRFGACAVGFGANRANFLMASLAASRHADLLLLGHINLLPIAWLLKTRNPTLNAILFVHGIEAWNDHSYRRRRFYEPFLLGGIDRIASVSQYTADRMRSHFGVGVEKFTIFPNAVDGPTSPWSEPASTPTLLTVSRMAAHDRGKNLDAVLLAFAALVPSINGAKLEVVGDGELRTQLESLAASLGIASRVAFLGAVDDAELVSCYRRAAGFVLPSSKEGFGIVYLEAWKYGVPVICGTEGAAREIVDHGKNGYIVDPADTPGLSAYMATLLTDSNLARAMGKNGAEKVAARFLDSSFHDNLRRLLVNDQ